MVRGLSPAWRDKGLNELLLSAIIKRIEEGDQNPKPLSGACGAA
jgi:hypothetical protein